MYVYEGGIRNKIHVSAYLSEVHKHMLIKFKTLRDNGDKEQAKELEIFFQNLKNYVSKNGNNKENIVNNAMYDVLIQRLEEIEARRGGHHKIHTLFTRTGTGREAGFQFEEDLGDVVQAMLELAIDKHLDELRDSIVIGDVKGTTGGIVNQKVAKILEEVDKTSKAKLKSGEKPPYTLVDVYGKIDVGGLKLELNIDGNPTTEFERIASLLNEATFSAKSYRSISGYGEAQKMLDEIRPDLHLGNSNPFRAISGVLGDYGASMPTIQSAFCASWNDWKNGNTLTGRYIYHMRFMYELSGIGILNRTSSGGLESAGLVKFFIYNDPTGTGIFVASTAEIIYQVMMDESNIDNPFGRDIVIKKASMRNHRYH